MASRIKQADPNHPIIAPSPAAPGTGGSSIWSDIGTPALAGAIGTGALSGLLSLGPKDENETPWQRRRRILRNTLIGAGVGGVGGKAVEWGADKVWNAPPPTKPSSNWLTSAGGFLRKHLPTTGAGVMGAVALAHGRRLTPKNLELLSADVQKGLVARNLHPGAARSISAPPSGDILGRSMGNAAKVVEYRNKLTLGYIQQGLPPRQAQIAAAEALHGLGASSSLTLRHNPQVRAKFLQEHGGLLNKLVGKAMQYGGAPGRELGYLHARMSRPGLAVEHKNIGSVFTRTPAMAAYGFGGGLAADQLLQPEKVQ